MRRRWPGSRAGRRLAQEAFPQLVRLVVDTIRLPVLAGDAPGGGGIVLELLQSLLLSRFGQMDPELEQHEAFVGEHLLVLADRLHARVHLIRVDFALHMSEHRFVVPGVHQDADLALRRQRAPIAPCGRSRGLFGSAWAERDHVNVPRVHPFGQLVGRFSATPALDPGDDQEQRTAAGLRQIELGVEQQLAELWLLARINPLGNRVADFGGFEHAESFRRSRKVRIWQARAMPCAAA